MRGGSALPVCCVLGRAGAVRRPWQTCSAQHPAARRTAGPGPRSSHPHLIVQKHAASGFRKAPGSTCVCTLRPAQVFCAAASDGPSVSPASRSDADEQERTSKIRAEVTRRIKAHGEAGRMKAAIQELAGLAKVRTPAYDDQHTQLG